MAGDLVMAERIAHSGFLRRRHSRSDFNRISFQRTVSERYLARTLGRVMMWKWKLVSTDPSGCSAFFTAEPGTRADGVPTGGCHGHLV